MNNFKVELFWPATYHYVKDRFCRVGVCKHNGNCSDCEYGLLRRYAARDTDRINALENQLVDKDKIIEYLSNRVDKLEKKLKIHGIPIEE
jgi:hypothetical protein